MRRLCPFKARKTTMNWCLWSFNGARRDLHIKEDILKSDFAADVAYIFKSVVADAEVFQEFESLDFSNHFENMENILKAKVFQKHLSKLMAPAETENDEKLVPTQAVENKKQKPPPLKSQPKPKKLKETQYICEICGKIYPLQCRLTEHIKWHKGIKPHKCEICGHCFTQQQQLKRHMNTHTGNRPYKCNYCPSAFADVSTRNKHHRIHSKERPYVCVVCDKGFKALNTLKYHKMRHTGERPHRCEICGKGFLVPYQLRKHKDSHAKMEAEGEAT